MTRAALIDAMRRRLTRDSFPRLQISLILTAAGAAAFLSSFIALQAGLTSMSVRYGLATLAGYGVFLLLIRVWLAYQRGRWETRIDLDPGIDVDLFSSDASSPETSSSLFGGGRSGGAGASDSWAPVGDTHGVSSTPGPSDSGFSLDLDELWYLVIAIACVAAGALAVFYVVYLSPVLLAEVALDGAIVTALYRRLRKHEAGSWFGSALRHTWLPATALTIMMVVAGWALQRSAPEARSIGAVIQSLSSSP